MKKLWQSREEPDQYSVRVAQLKEFVRQYRLDQQLPGPASSIQRLPDENPSRVDMKVLKTLEAQLKPFMDYHAVNPFPISRTEPPGRGRFILGRQKGNNAPITAGWDELSMHFLVDGATGWGKSTFLHHLLLQAQDRSIPLLFFDPKLDARYLAIRDRHCLVIHKHAPFNLLQVPAFLDRDEFISIFVTLIAKSMWGGENLKAVLRKGLKEVFSQHDQPCIRDLMQAIKKQESKKNSYQENNAIHGMNERLQNLITYWPGLSTTRYGITYEELFQRSIYITLKWYDETSEYLYPFMLSMLLSSYMERQERNQTNRIVYMDESILKLGNQEKYSNIDRTNLLSQIITIGREHGLAFLISSTLISGLESLVKANTNTKLFFPYADFKETNEAISTLGLTQEQADYYRYSLKLGEGILMRSGNERHPILLTFKDLGFDKTVTEEDWQTALQRINQYRREPLPKASEVRPEKEEAPSDSEEFVEPEAQVRRKSESSKRKDEALTRNEEKLLKAIIRELLTVTDAYRKAGVNPQSGRNAHERLLAKGLLTEEKIRIRSGRGGQPKLLMPTEEAHKLLRTKPSERPKGSGSPQHRYLAQEYAKGLPGAQIEFLVSKKRVDLYLRYKGEDHSIIFHIVNNESGQQPEEGDQIAIEIEITSPEKTAANNIMKNREAGISHTIIATLPEDLEKTRSHLADQLPEDLQSHYTITNALELLQTLRGGPR